ncbi:hypothetical protein C0992_005125 [Termitomyces sp. T32_za158]|nr:hypothetical protein C0992_005125 [Termitomyces sp. T32_za158]
MSSVVLPFDLLGKILSYLEVDGKDDMLKSCALVCRTFFDIARELMNRNVWVGWWTYEACTRRLDTSVPFARPKTELIKGFCIDGKGYMIWDPAEWLTSILLHDFTSLRELSIREMNFNGLSKTIRNRLEGVVRSGSLHSLIVHSVQFPESLLYGTEGLKHLTMINATFVEGPCTLKESKVKPPVLHTLTIYADRGWHQMSPADHPISRAMKWLLEGNKTIGLVPVDLSKLKALNIRSGILRSTMFQDDELNQVLRRCRATLKHIKFTASFEVDDTIDLHFECLEAITTLHIHFPIMRNDLLIWLAKTLRSLAMSISLRVITISVKCNSDVESVEKLNWKDFSSIMNGTSAFLPSWHLDIVFCQDRAPGFILEFGDGEKAAIHEFRSRLPNFDDFVSIREGKVYGELIYGIRFFHRRYSCIAMTEWGFLRRHFSLGGHD